MKEINLNHTLYNLIHQYPEVADILYLHGFPHVKDQGMLQTIGRVMSPTKMCIAKGISYEKICNVFIEHGFIIKEV
jgi:uncharacterized protein